MLTSSILQMGFVWHITLTTDSASMLSLASLAGFLPLALFGTFAGVIVDRLPLKATLVGADLFIAAVSALVATVAVLAARLDVGGAQELSAASPAPGQGAAEKDDAAAGQDVPSEKGLGIFAQARSIASETAEGYRALRGFRGLFALLWCGFVFTLAFSPISALFPIMTLGHFGGTTADAATAEIAFSVGMIAGSAALASWGGFKNRAITVVAATALYGAATVVAGLLGANGYLVFLAMSFLMGLSSPFYSGPQTALMQEKVPPEYLGRVFGLYGAIMSWAMPIGLAASSLFADVVSAPAWFVGAGAAMVALAAATWAIPSIRHIEDER